MDSYRELKDRLCGLHQDPTTLLIGKVASVDGLTCMIQLGSVMVEAQLRPTALQKDGHMLMVPAVGSAVVVGSTTGDLTQLIVLAMDQAEKVEVTGKITFNGGKLGGLINVPDLTTKLNELVNHINTHTHTCNMGSPTSPPLMQAQTFAAKDYEDKQVMH